MNLRHFWRFQWNPSTTFEQSHQLGIRLFVSRAGKVCHFKMASPAWHNGNCARFWASTFRRHPMSRNGHPHSEDSSPTVWASAFNSQDVSPRSCNERLDLEDVSTMCRNKCRWAWRSNLRERSLAAQTNDVTERCGENVYDKPTQEESGFMPQKH